MGRGARAPQFLTQTIVKVGLGPPLFQIKRAQIDFGPPPTFKIMTMPLIDDTITIRFLNYPHPTLLPIHAMEIIQFSLLLPTYLVL